MQNLKAQLLDPSAMLLDAFISKIRSSGGCLVWGMRALRRQQLDKQNGVAVRRPWKATAPHTQHCPGIEGRKQARLCHFRTQGCCLRNVTALSNLYRRPSRPRMKLSIKPLANLRALLSSTVPVPCRKTPVRSIFYFLKKRISSCGT